MPNLDPEPWVDVRTNERGNWLLSRREGWLSFEPRPEYSQNEKDYR